MKAHETVQLNIPAFHDGKQKGEYFRKPLMFMDGSAKWFRDPDELRKKQRISEKQRKADSESLKAYMNELVRQGEVREKRKQRSHEKSAATNV